MDSDNLRAKKIADRYIARDGSEPTYEDASALADARHEALRDLASFIAWHDPKYIMGGVTAEDAYAAMCKLLNLDTRMSTALYNIVRGE